LSPPQSSPSERRRPELDDTIILNDAEQPEPAREPGRAFPAVLGCCYEWRIIDDGLAGIGWIRRQGEHRWSPANRLLRGGRQRANGRRNNQRSGRVPAALHGEWP
jgi:hypothetical protein